MALAFGPRAVRIPRRERRAAHVRDERRGHILNWPGDRESRESIIVVAVITAVLAASPRRRPTGRSGGARPHRHLARDRPAVQWPAGGPPVVWIAPTSAPATARSPSGRPRLTCRGCATGRASSRRSTSPTARWCGAKTSARRRQRSRAGAAQHADGRRRSALRAHRERRPRLPARQDGGVVWQQNILSDSAAATSSG